MELEDLMRKAKTFKKFAETQESQVIGFRNIGFSCKEVRAWYAGWILEFCKNNRQL